MSQNPIRITDSLVNQPGALNIDFKLIVSTVEDGEGVDFSGIKSYTIENYNQDEGFGITNVEIDIQPNLQPIVDITFKDLYGNLVFGRNKKFNYDVLFSLPYPKFLLTVKGYIGRPVEFLLNVKTVSTTYLANDGSYEIKAQFVPNIFGFFNDIPYQYLYAVPKLKKMRGVNYTGGSIVEITKIGNNINKEVESVKENYNELYEKIRIIQSDPITIYNSYLNGFLGDKSKKIKNTQAPQELLDEGFKDLIFNLIYTNKDKKTIIDKFKEELSKERVGQAIKLSILKGVNIDINEKEWYKKVEKLYTNENVIKIETLLQDNLDVLDTFSRKQGISQVENKLISTQTIFNVMTRLASDAAYVLGYILEGGINGVYPTSNPNELNDRKDNNKLSNIGIYYPFEGTPQYKSDSYNIQVQVPYTQAIEEKKYVDQFALALYEGQIEAEKIIQEIQSTVNETTKISKPLTDIEILQPNVYEANNEDQIITNVIQRSGLSSLFLKEDKSKDDLENLIPTLNKLATSSNLVLTQFVKYVKAVIRSDGSLKTTQGLDTIVEGNKTFRDYIAVNYLSPLVKVPGFTNDMFEDANPKSLKVKYMINNGIMYYNLASLGGESDADTISNDFRNDSTNPDGYLVLYAAGAAVQNTSSATAPNLFDLVTGSIGGSTKELSSFSFEKYGQYWKVKTDDIQGSDEKAYFDAGKLLTNQFVPLKDLVVYVYPDAATKPPGSRNIVLQTDSLASFYTKGGDDEFLIDFEDKEFRKILFNYAASIDEQINPANKKNLLEKQRANAKQGVDSSQPVVEPYQRDKDQINTIYTQFHHIFNAWNSLYKNIYPNQTGKVASLAEGFEDKFSGKISTLNSSNTNLFDFNFQYPLQAKDGKGVDVANSLINTQPLVEDNAQTMVFSVMTNICTLNNFLLLSIPGGASSSIKDIFTPFQSLDDPSGNNAFSIIWTPTPENRYSGNDNKPLYQDSQGFLNALGNLTQEVALFEFGSPQNIVVKSIKASSNDNKVTSESIQATSDIVNNQNQNKDKRFDCSLLAVMQGRSYKISIDLIGNAQIFPTQLIAINNLPIFSGLYQVMKVKHSLSPNNMDTSIEAMKLKYDGKKEFLSIPPITIDSFQGEEASTVVSKGIQEPEDKPRENLNSSQLNYGFLQSVKNEKLKNSTDINAFIKKATNYNDFPTWFNTVMVGNGTFFNQKISSKNWSDLWDNIISIEWGEKYGTGGINILEFLCINSIIYKEVGGKYMSKSEIINSINNAIPGIAYTYNKINGKKATYNKHPNKTASILFNDNNYIQANSNKLFSKDPRVLRSNNLSWVGGTFPVEIFANDKNQALRGDPETFINQADFYKFRGRGYIQSTWRTAYRDVTNFVLNYSGSDTLVNKYKGLWSNAPYNLNVEKILTTSSTEDWDELFTSFNICAASMKSHAIGAGDYQYIPDLTVSEQQLINKITKVATRINGCKPEAPYAEALRTMVFTQIDAMANKSSA